MITTDNIVADLQKVEADVAELSQPSGDQQATAAALSAVTVTVNNAVGQMQAIATRIIANASDATEVQNQAQTFSAIANTLQADVSGIIASAMKGKT
ncbi:hypothetical protein [Bradyrhizobium sp.]|uniref:hypothetical protein n=1 Tax=Bradyrhizobium sp. TaxID=376 RepID=UPI00263529E8|nr:hypothetical protein [Bradyrhizobium sp.]